MIEFDIPKEYEIQNESISNIVSGLSQLVGLDSDAETYNITLQQVGLNILEPGATDNYSRITVKITTNDYFPVSNSVFKAKFESLSWDEELAFFELYKLSISSLIEVKEWLDFSLTTISNYAALHVSYKRSAVADKQDVVVKMYDIFTKDYKITITCSYRENNESIFLPAIEAFLSSIKLNLPVSRVSKYLYTQKISGTNQTFLWPKEEITWQSSFDPQANTISAIYDGILSDGYLIQVNSMKFKNKVFSYLQNIYLQMLLTETSKNMKLMLSNKPYTLVENKVSGGAGRLKYQYSVAGVHINGLSYTRFLDEYQLLIVTMEWYDFAEKECKEIITSLGF